MELYKDSLSELALNSFSIPYLYPLQRFVISNTLEQKDQIIIFPTGSGKSLCFQLPSQFLEKPTMVIVPLLSIMGDQLRSLRRISVSTGMLKGGMTAEQKEKLWNDLKLGKIKIFYTTPESAVLRNNMNRIKTIGLSHLVIDEAHCVSEWGKSFRPSYLNLKGFIREVRPRTISAFTATATPHVVTAVRDTIFSNRNPRIVTSNPDRPNISYSVIPVISKSYFIRTGVTRRPKPMIIFVRSRRRTEYYAR